MASKPPPGTVAMEWVGMRSPLSEPAVQLAVAMGRLPPAVVAVLREMARRAVYRVDGRTRRIIRRGTGAGQLPQLSQDWIWGPQAGVAVGAPGSYIQFLPHRDADAVKSSGSGREFHLHGERDGAPGGVLLPAAVGKPLIVQTEAPEVFASLAAFQRAMGWA